MSHELDRERRQLGLASAALEAYRDRTLGLARLIADLDALWNEFHLQGDDWLEDFRGHWWTLEQIYAVALDRELSELPEDFQVAVDEAVDQLRFAVDVALERCQGD